MGRDEVELEVEKAIISAVLWITKAKEMNFSLIPAKGLQSGGLGIGLNTYRGFLSALFADYLPQKAPYSRYAYPRGFASSTHNEPLRTLRYLLTEQLFSLSQAPAVKAISLKPSAAKKQALRNRAKRDGQ